jgi:class 3 adenylate cyclase
LERSWPEGLEVRVRIGLHTGRPTLTRTGYIGLPVHTVARVCDAAHGGQILLSGETRLAIERSKAAGLRFRALGRRRLTGLPSPVTLFQIEADGLPARFPALRTGARARRKREPDGPSGVKAAHGGPAQLHLGLDKES